MSVGTCISEDQMIENASDNRLSSGHMSLLPGQSGSISGKLQFAKADEPSSGEGGETDCEVSLASCVMFCEFILSSIFGSICLFLFHYESLTSVDNNRRRKSNLSTEMWGTALVHLSVTKGLKTLMPMVFKMLKILRRYLPHLVVMDM